MRIGAIFPQTEIGADPVAVRTWAQAAEELGYHHIVTFDHVLGAGSARRPSRGYTDQHLFHEVFVLFGYLAAVTSTIELATGVLVLPQRQTALVAKQAAEIDVLSGGRLRLGVGVGWNDVEYDALGQPFRQRGARLDEQVALLRALWAEPTVTFEGRWDHVDDAGILPRPARGGIPIWFGGHSEAALRRVGELGDGWMPYVDPDARVTAMLGRIRQHAEAAGRADVPLGLEPRLTLATVPEQDRVEHVRGWRELGATHLCVNTMGLGLTTVDEHVAALRDTITLLAPAVAV